MGATPPAARRGGAPAGLGVDWTTITSSQPLPAPIGAVTFSHNRLSAAARCGALSVSAAGVAGGAGGFGLPGAPGLPGPGGDGVPGLSPGGDPVPPPLPPDFEGAEGSAGWEGVFSGPPDEPAARRPLGAPPGPSWVLSDPPGYPGNRLGDVPGLGDVPPPPRPLSPAPPLPLPLSLPSRGVSVTSPEGDPSGGAFELPAAAPTAV
ncbi:hypothetical protein [Streptomyces sp. S063]|uniref:hypothetical protein n=1 Tax=Streptomyces sp. S063 TaxID=2005885 RepID=UPI0010084B63|nr:hypothetical protein [Streptomyces sp. S063]